MDGIALVPCTGSPEAERGVMYKDKESGRTTFSEDTCMWPVTLVSSTMTFVTPKLNAFVNPDVESTLATEGFDEDH